MPARGPAGHLRHPGRPHDLRHAHRPRRRRRSSSPTWPSRSSPTPTTPSGRSRSATASSSTTAPDLDAKVVKNNLDAFRGQYPARTSLLFTVRPRGHRHGRGRRRPHRAGHDQAAVGVVPVLPLLERPHRHHGPGPARRPENCGSNLIGTGPFTLDWAGQRPPDGRQQPDYWRTDADGDQLPYLDEIEFRPIPDQQQRVNALQVRRARRLPRLQRHRGADRSTSCGPRRGRARQQRVGGLRRGRLLMFNAAEAAVRQPAGPAGGALAVDREMVQRDPRQGRLTWPRVPSPRVPSATSRTPASRRSRPGRGPAPRRAVRGRDRGRLHLHWPHRPGRPDGPAGPVKQWLEADAGITVELEVRPGQAHHGGDRRRTSRPSTAGATTRASTPTTCTSGGTDGRRRSTSGRINDPEIDRLLDEGRETPTDPARQQIYEELNRASPSSYNAVGSGRSGRSPCSRVHGVVGAQPARRREAPSRAWHWAAGPGSASSRGRRAGEGTRGASVRWD